MFAMWTSLERQVRTEFQDDVAVLLAVVVGDPPRLPSPRGADPMQQLDVRVANRALDAGFGLRWVVETVVRRRLSRVYGAGIVEIATVTETPQR